MKTLLIILLLVIILVLVTFIAILIYRINKGIIIGNTPIKFYIKTVDGDDIINVEEIEQVTQRYNTNEAKFEIIYYLKSNHELKEEFDNGLKCRERFDDIYDILNDFDY